MGFMKRWFGGPDEPEPQPDEGTGIFAGLFVASPDELGRWSLRGLTPSSWPAVEFKHLETVKLGTLEAILSAVQYEGIDQDELHNVIRDGGSDGPWVVRVRSELVVALADVTPALAASAAAQWADTDEFKGRPTDSPRPEVVESLRRAIIEMGALAKDVARARECTC